MSFCRNGAAKWVHIIGLAKQERCEKFVNLGKLGLTQVMKVGKIESLEWTTSGFCPQGHMRMLYDCSAFWNRRLFDTLKFDYNRDDCIWNLGVF